MKLEHSISKPISLVADYLFDMEQFAKVHPVIYRVENLGENQYKVYEKLPVFPLPFTYFVTLFPSLDRRSIVMKANVKGLARIDLSFYLSENEGITKVEEIVTFTTYLPIVFVMKTIFAKIHKQLFENIERM
ncbi:MAG: hypothetical protein ACKVTZ_22510 [Bacteroidia bacterium]